MKEKERFKNVQAENHEKEWGSENHPAYSRSLSTNGLKSVIKSFMEANCPGKIKESGPNTKDLWNSEKSQQPQINTMIFSYFWSIKKRKNSAYKKDPNLNFFQFCRGYN